MEGKSKMDRRKFLKASTIGVFGYGLLASSGLTQPKWNNWAKKGFYSDSPEIKIKDYHNK